MSSAIKTFIKQPLALYVTTTCPFCSNARKLASQHGINASVIELDNESKRKDIVDELVKLTNQKTVPYVFSQGYFIGGFSDLSAKPQSFWEKLKQVS